ncbi:MAG TPA: nitroreductase family protein [Candidatus Limiplasma sp.]|nr:nitroreductase family protein [Candidatus Limiplasma sp.]HPS81734.1 nitroreductase family protein [Candidatus Limiplasma sp.]
MVGTWNINGFYDNTKLTSLFEAVQRRESCRLFAAAPSAENWNVLLTAADELAMPGVRIALGICENSLFQPMLGLFQKFENVQRFAAIILTENTPRAAVNAGVCGEMFLLRAVELGMGGCWVTGTYKRGQVGIQVHGEEKLAALMPLGNPKNPPELPLSRKRKEIAALCPEYDTLSPALKEVVQLVHIAPSAMNLQPWSIKAVHPATLTITVNLAMQRLDLGIAVCHALLALGTTPALFTLDDAGQSATLELL